MMGVALGRTRSVANRIWGDSFMVRASCSADPDKNRVHSISVMDPGFPVCGGAQLGDGTWETHTPSRSNWGMGERL